MPPDAAGPSPSRWRTNLVTMTGEPLLEDTVEPASDVDRSALRIAERLIQLLDRGGFTATYKYAVLIGLMDVCMERTSSTGAPPSMITTRQLAEKVIELYWLHCAPYYDPDCDEGAREPPQTPPSDPAERVDRGVLHQSTGGEAKQALIVRQILAFRESVDPQHERSMPLSRARAVAPPGAYEELVRLVEWTLIHMPLPRLQLIGRQEDLFLYEYNFTQATPRGAVQRYQRGEAGTFDNRLNLRPGVGAALLALNGMLRPLVYRAWTRMVADMNGIKESKLEKFLFGDERISLAPVRPSLHALQAGRCFYCAERLSSAYHVDHFLPWSRHADNSIENLVAAHDDCNGKKSDFLAAAEHVERWSERSKRDGAELARIAGEQRWESQPERTFSVARAIYGRLPDDAPLWRAGRDFVRMERPRIVKALAA
jgi:HNH endonuclease